MAITIPQFNFDPKKIREKTIYENYGMTHPDDFQPPDMTQNPMGLTPSNGPDPFNTPVDIRPLVNSPTPNFQDMMGDFDTTRQDSYNQLLSQRPQREDPGIARRIVAAGMSVGPRPGDVKDPLGTQEGVMYAPHARAMADWSAQVEPAYRSAQLENTANSNERQLRSSYMTNKTNMDRYEAMNDQATRRNDITEQRNKDLKDIADKKNEIESAWRAGYTFEKNGNELWATRKDGSTFMVTRNADFSPLELERWRHRGDMEEIGARTRGAVEVKGTIPGVNPASTSGRGGQTPEKQFEDRRTQVLTQALDSDEYSEFVETPATANGLWKLKPPEKPFWGEPDPAKVKRFKELQAMIAAGKFEVPTATTTEQAPPVPEPEVPETGIGPTKPAGPAGWFGQKSQSGPTIADRAKRASYPPDFVGPIDVPVTEPLKLPANKTGNLGTAAERNVAGQKNLDLRNKAIAFLQQHNMPIEEANIEHAIKVGDVK